MTNRKGDDILKLEVNVVGKKDKCQNSKLSIIRRKISARWPIFVCLGISFAIGVVLLRLGLQYDNDNCLNLGISFLSGTIVGIFCNISITQYYRVKDKTIQANNEQLLAKKSAYLEQVDSLTAFVSMYEDVIASLNAFICSNPNLTDGETDDGYYDVCKSLWYLPDAMHPDESILSQEQIKLMEEARFHLITIRNHIEKKEYSQIKLTDEALFATKLFGVCLTINGSIKVRVRELEAKLK